MNEYQRKMQYTNYQTEFYLLLDRKCQELMDSLYNIIVELDYYRATLGFKIPPQTLRFEIKVREMLQNYDTPIKET